MGLLHEETMTPPLLHYKMPAGIHVHGQCIIFTIGEGGTPGWVRSVLISMGLGATASMQLPSIWSWRTCWPTSPPSPGKMSSAALAVTEPLAVAEDHLAPHLLESPHNRIAKFYTYGTQSGVVWFCGGRIISAVQQRILEPFPPITLGPYCWDNSS